jgi:hypothetical protein
MSIEDPVATPSPAPVVSSQPMGVTGPMVDLYDEATDVTRVLTPEQIELYKRHELTSFNPALAVVLSILTVGLFPCIYYGLQNSKLPTVKDIDPTAGKAIGFLFIPYFNIYWQIVVWARLVDRINFQLRLRGKPVPYSRSRAAWAMPMVILVGIGYIVALMNIYQSQQAINELAAERGA